MKASHAASTPQGAQLPIYTPSRVSECILQIFTNVISEGVIVGLFWGDVGAGGWPRGTWVWKGKVPADDTRCMGMGPLGSHGAALASQLWEKQIG